MKLSIGENIKFYRKSKDITQEGLAEMLGVSCQSVSRWELGTCYPDMELLPVIAEIFDISIDKLLGVDNLIEKKKVSEYLERFQDAISVGKIDECIAIAREGVSEYPNNFALLNKLMYALFVSGDETGNIPNWEENMKNYDKEIISLGERIIKYCPDQDIRLEATSRLAFQHCEMGRREIGRKIYETLPSQELCRENQIWWGLENNEKLDFLHKKIKQDYDSLKEYMWVLARTGFISAKESVEIFKKIFELDNLICDGQAKYKSWGIIGSKYEVAKLYARLDDTENAYKYLTEAAKAAKNFVNRPATQSFTSLLLGTVTINKSDYETADTRPLTEIMLNDWLPCKEFDNMRESKEFNEIIRILE